MVSFLSKADLGPILPSSRSKPNWLSSGLAAAQSLFYLLGDLERQILEDSWVMVSQ